MIQGWMDRYIPSYFADDLPPAEVRRSAVAMIYFERLKLGWSTLNSLQWLIREFRAKDACQWYIDDHVRIRKCGEEPQLDLTGLSICALNHIQNLVGINHDHGRVTDSVQAAKWRQYFGRRLRLENAKSPLLAAMPGWTTATAVEKFCTNNTYDDFGMDGRMQQALLRNSRRGFRTTTSALHYV